MKIQMKRIIASMLAVTMVLSNSNLTVFAGETGSENEPVVEGQGNLDSALTSASEENAGEAVKENESKTQTEEEQQESGSNVPKEEQQESGSNVPKEEQQESGSNVQKEEQQENGSNTQSEEQQENGSNVQSEEQQENESNAQTEKQQKETTVSDEELIQTVDDLVKLSKKSPQEYQSKSIKLAPHDTGEWDLSGTEFKGLGSDAYPFKGEVSFSGNYTGYITLNKSLFHAISGDAKINSTLNLRAADNMTAPILAENYVAGEKTDASSQTIRLNIDAESEAATEENANYSSFGGIIGTLGENASVSLEVNSIIPAAKTAVSGEGNKGFFCNTMKEGSSLNLIRFTGNADFNVTSTNETAGALVGCMAANANLTIGTEFVYSGSVTGAQNAGGLVGSTAVGAQITLRENYTVSGSITSGNGNAGGLIGLAENNPVSVTDGKKVSVTNASLSTNGTSGAAGGLFGFDTISQENLSLDLAVYSVENVTITSGKYAGGVFGVLQNGAESDGTYTYTIGIEAKANVSSTGNGVENYGGLIGKYEAKNLASALNLKDLQLTSVHKGTWRMAAILAVLWQIVRLMMLLDSLISER